MMEQQSPAQGKPSSPAPEVIIRTSTLQEIFNLDEGSVVLTYPATLSAQSYEDLADCLNLFLRKAKRRAERGDEDKSYLE